MSKYILSILTVLFILASFFAIGCIEDNSNSANEMDNRDTPYPDEDDAVEYGVEGVIIFDGKVDSFSNATVYLSVEDVSLQDAPSVVLSESVLHDISIDSADVRPIAYSISHPQLDTQMMYTLSVHIDVDGDGSLSSGDYYSTWHNEVPKTDGIGELDVHVEII